MKKIAQILVEKNIVKTNFTKPFLWTSGILSPIYCDCRELIADVEARDAVVDYFIQTIQEQNMKPDYIAGTATAGIPWAAFVAQKLNIPMLYVRSKPKSHGAGKMVEGGGQKGKNILVIEDAISTAGSSIVSANALRNELEAEVSHILAIFSWGTALADKNASSNNLTILPGTIFGEIAETLHENKKITTEELSDLNNFHENPTKWRA